MGESSRNIYTEPMHVRLRRALHVVFDHMRHETPSEHFRPSAQRDVGKTAAEASVIQMIIHDMRGYESSPVVMPDERMGWDESGNYHASGLRTEHVMPPVSDADLR